MVGKSRSKRSFRLQGEELVIADSKGPNSNSSGSVEEPATGGKRGGVVVAMEAAAARPIEITVLEKKKDSWSLQ